jgi:hypothetical protein
VLNPLWSVVLAIAVLGLVPCVAQADDPLISGFEAFVATPTPPVPTASYPFALEVTYDDSLPGWVRGSVFEWINGDWSLLDDGCNYGSCVVNVEADSAEELYASRDRRFKAVLYSSGDEYDSSVLVVHERRPHFSLRVVLDSGWITASIPESQSQGGTDLSTVIHEDGSDIESCNIYWLYCNAQFSAGHV